MNVRNLKLTITDAPPPLPQGGAGTIPAAPFVDVRVQATVTVATQFLKVFLFVELFADDTDEEPPRLTRVMALQDPKLLTAGTYTVDVTRRLPRWNLDEDPGVRRREVHDFSYNGIEGQIVTLFYKDDEFRARILLTTGFALFSDQHIAWSPKAVAPSQTPSSPLMSGGIGP